MADDPALAADPERLAAEIDGWLRAGLACQQVDRLADAEDCYRRALRLAPGHAEALHRLGLAAHLAGRPAEAAELIGQAIAADASDPARHSNLGLALLALRRPAEALESFERALALQPEFAAAHANRGNALAALRRLPEAVEAFDRALALDPQNPLAHFSRGSALLQLRRSREALASYEAAVALAPRNPVMRLGRAGLLKAMGRAAEALLDYEAVLAAQPEHAEALRQRALLLRALGRLSAAAEALAAALRLLPDDLALRLALAQVLQDRARQPEAQAAFEELLAACDARLAADPADMATEVRRCLALAGLDREAEALASAERALALAPETELAGLVRAQLLARSGHDAEALESLREIAGRPRATTQALHALGAAEMAAGAFDAAESALARTLARVPGDGAVHFALGTLRLLSGRYEEGWPDYDWRWQVRDFSAVISDMGEEELMPAPVGSDGVRLPPLWRGEALAGKRILVYGEQGIGDAVQFCRYVPLLPQLAGGPVHVVLLVHPPLRRLMAGLAGVGHLVQSGDPRPEVDVQCPLLGLPRRFGTTLEAIPAPASYLRAEPALREQWRARLAARPGPRIGLAWSGNPLHRNDFMRSMPLDLLAPLGDLPASFFAVQKGVRERDAAALARLGWIDNLGAEFGDLADTAAALAELDLVVSVDTSVVHIAGALGRPAWVMLPFVPDWRWLLGRRDSPWYPSLRLFRQPALRDWPSVVAEVRAALAGFLAARA